MTPPSTVPPVSASKTKLTPLTGLRFFAALHIFVFHIAAMPSPDEMRQMGEQTQAAQSGSESLDELTQEGAAAELGADAAEAGQQPPAQAGSSEAGGDGFMNRGLYKILPAPLARLFQRGFLSTSLFFMLSGFVLAYLYVDADGKQTIGNREFFLSRWIRLYPLHFIMLPLLLPMVLLFMSFFPTTTLWGFPVPKPAFVGASGVMSALLVQAWCPEAALTWNFATWALSAVAFFYVMFPWTVKVLSRQSRSTLWILFWLMPVLNLKRVRDADTVILAPALRHGDYSLPALQDHAARHELVSQGDGIEWPELGRPGDCCRSCDLHDS
ncbi:MAG: acyltransferase family protein [Planctomycetota bacterium]|nr:acyltransferase family protein [Planctomycetota bacterium]